MSHLQPAFKYACLAPKHMLPSEHYSTDSYAFYLNDFTFEFALRGFAGFWHEHYSMVYADRFVLWYTAIQCGKSHFFDS